MVRTGKCPSSLSPRPSLSWGCSLRALFGLTLEQQGLLCCLLSLCPERAAGHLGPTIEALPGSLVLATLCKSN